MVNIFASQACNIVIFGAKGDLARRKLLPSLYQLEKIGAMHVATKIIGVGRAKWNAKMYIQVVRTSLKTFMNEPIDEKLWLKFSSRFDFCNLDVTQTKLFHVLLNKLSQKELITVHYFAVPSSVFSYICKGLNLVSLNKEPNRIVMEKPLGIDLISARMINDQVSKYFNEKQIYRIDHYLGKDMILNLLALRFANSLFISNWDNRTIDHVQITVAEDVGIEGRWGYFDSVGQMRDMIQSHLLQILAIITMSPPSRLTADYIRDEKVKILRALRTINSSDIHHLTVRGQYTSGFIRGQEVPGYLEEIGANKDSVTETFVSIRVDIDNWRWSGVPFYLRTGKRLASKYSEIVIYFKYPLVNLFSNFHRHLPQNKLIIRLQPNEGIDLDILNKRFGLEHNNALQITRLSFSFIDDIYQQNYVINDAYSRLLLEVMHGVQTLFVRRDEIEISWKWIDSIVEAWKDKYNTPDFYQAGTWGPISASNMILRDNRSWYCSYNKMVCLFLFLLFFD